MDSPSVTRSIIMYRKTLLALTVVAAMPLIAATDRTLYVDTLNDEDGENASACSLREALKAAATNKAYGGCIAGQVSGTDKIKLKTGVYELTGTLNVEGEVSISGEDPITYDKSDAVNNTFPARTKLETTIKGNSSFPLFNSTVTRSSINLNNLVLDGGGSNGNGGAIRAGGSVNLNRVNILNSKALGSGGAIYLEGDNSNLSATDVLIQGNTAARGAAIGMSCIDNVNWTKRSISLDRTAVVQNGSTNTQNIIEFCGTPASTINASTIAQNTTSGNGTSAIIKYTHDQILDNQVYVLHPNSSLSLVSNTITENKSKAALLYDNVGRLILTHNLIAYNTGGVSCGYLLGKPVELGNPIDLKDSKISLSFSAFKKYVKGGVTTDTCMLPELLFKENLDKTVDLTTASFSTVLYKLKNYAENSGFLPIYLPKRINIEGQSSATEWLIDRGGDTSCSTFDQRGLTRNTTLISSGSISITNPNQCDIGAVEVGKLRAADFVGTVNTSYVNRVNDFENSIKRYEELVKSSDTLEIFLNYFKDLLSDSKIAFTEFKKPANVYFRQVYISVFPTSVEQERLSAEGASSDNSIFEKFEDNKYTVSASPIGRGPERFMDTKDSNLIIAGSQNTIRCQWNPTLKQVLISRITLKDGQPSPPEFSYDTPAGDYEYCKYTIRLNSNNSVVSTGYIQTQFMNIAPVATDDTYNIKYGSNQVITMDLLANDNDDGDGPKSALNYPTKRNVFFKDPTNERFSNIKIVSKPSLGKLKFEYEQPCPDNSETRPAETCYGGKLTYAATNTFSPFNDSFTYKVLDEDLKESNEATVRVINTATTSDDTRSKGGSGGGAVGIVGLFGLGLLGLLRRRLK